MFHFISRNVIKRTFWHVRPTKTKKCLRIRAVWSVIVGCMKKRYIFGNPICAQWRFSLRKHAYTNI